MTARTFFRQAVLGLGVLALAGCAIETVEVQNRQAARQLAEETRPPGSVYIGWRVFQDRCARCHGESGTGTSAAPDLLPRVRNMGPRRFMDVVLHRYDWGLPPAGDEAARTARVEQALQRGLPTLQMPAWQGEPRVTAHIADLQAYLWARAEGGLGAGRPQP